MSTPAQGRHDGCVRGFVQLSRAWYADANRELGVVDDVMFGYYHPEGGTTGELAMRWYELGDEPAARLEVFADAWDALATFGDVIARLGTFDPKGLAPAEFCALLVELGFADQTPERRGASSAYGGAR